MRLLLTAVTVPAAAAAIQSKPTAAAELYHQQKQFQLIIKLFLKKYIYNCATAADSKEEETVVAVTANLIHS